MTCQLTEPKGKLVDYNNQGDWGVQEGYSKFFLLVKLLFFSNNLKREKDI